MSASAISTGIAVLPPPGKATPGAASPSPFITGVLVAGGMEAVCSSCGDSSGLATPDGLTSRPDPGPSSAASPETIWCKTSTTCQGSRKADPSRIKEARQPAGQTTGQAGWPGRDLETACLRGSVFRSATTCCLLKVVALLGERRPANRDDH
jgi:hypothetical protein